MDHSRLYDGFADLSRGMDGGRSASIILPNQVAAAENVTFRGSFAKTRPPVWKHALTFESETTRERFAAGLFQGALFYQATESAHIVSIGGRLFRVEMDNTNLVTEITPKVPIVVTADFTVPALNGSVVADVTSESVFTVGQVIEIDSGTYTITNRFANQLELTYNGGAANATVSAGAAILDDAGASIFEYRLNPTGLDFVHIFQAQNYAITLAGQQRPLIYDGASVRQASIAGEIPPGMFGIYVWGRIWIVLPDRQAFIAGDLINTTTLSDSSDILKFTENDFYNEGGTFGVPLTAGPITAVSVLANQDTSLGQGNLLVGTSSSIFSVNTPVDRTTWKNLTFPIQTVALTDYGPLGPRWVPQVNGDWWYRAEDGYRSFMTARREIQVWGHVPMSREIEPILDQDADAFLFYGSGILFDNRLIMTAAPYRSALGIAHRGMAVLNFDLLSNIAGKAMPAWEGGWSGITPLQLVKGIHRGTERAFAWVANDSCLELWEFKKQKNGGFYDQQEAISEGEKLLTRVSIESWVETRSMDFKTPRNLKGLRTAELYVEDIVDNVTINVKFRPDRYPTWVDWGTIELCATVTQCTIQAPEGSECNVWTQKAKGYAARILLPNPPENCNVMAGMPVDEGYEFQFRLEWTGNCQVQSFVPHANLKAQDMEGSCPTEQACTTVTDCGTPWFAYSALPLCLPGSEIPEPPEPPEPPPFGCIDAPFPSESIEDNIDGLTAAPNRPGSFCKNITFSGTTGQMVNLWMHSADFDTYLILIDPDGIVVATDDSSGYDPITSFGDSSCIRTTLAKTGTYTVECTTYTAGATGFFTLVRTPSVVNSTIFCGTGTNNFMRDMMYVPVTDRIWAFNQIGNFSTTDEYFVINPNTLTIETSFNSPGSIVGFRYPPARSFYNTTDNKVYAILNSGELVRIDPVTFAFTSITFLTGGFFAESDMGLAWDAATNRVFCSLLAPTVRVFDLDTNTLVADIALPGEIHTANLSAIDGYIYAPTKAGNLLKIDAATLAVTNTGIGVRALVPNSRAVPEVGLLFATGPALNTVNVIDVATDTVVATFAGGAGNAPFEFAIWNPCAERVYVSMYQSTGSIPPQGVVWFDPTTNELDNYVTSPEAEGMAYHPGTKRVYLASRSNANVVVVS